MSLGVQVSPYRPIFNACVDEREISRTEELKILCYLRVQDRPSVTILNVPIRQEQSDNSQKIMDEVATTSRDTNFKI